MPRRRPFVATVSALALGAASTAVVVTLGASPAGAVTKSCTDGDASCPQLSGPLTEGQVESTTNGSFAGATSYTYRWQVCTSPTLTSSCSDIAGATNNEYVSPEGATATQYLRVVVTGHDATSAADEASAIVGQVHAGYNGSGFPASSGGNLPPSITDTSSTAGDYTPYVGDALASSSATWSVSSGTSTVYQWTRCNASGTACSPIPGVAPSTSPTGYQIAPDDFGQTIRMRARGTNDKGTSEQYSSPIGPVERRPGSPTPTPGGGAGDQTAPQTRFTSKPKATVKGTGAKVTVRFAFAADEPAHFQCKLDKGAFKPCSSPARLLVAASKAGIRHTFKVRAIDAAGNVDPSPSTFTFVAKRATPRTTLARTG